MASLTRDEGRRRAALVDVTRYDVRLDLRGLLDGAELRSVTTITFDCTEPGASTFVDVVAEQLHAVRLNGSEVTDPVFDGARLTVDGLAATNVLEVESSTTRTGERAGIHRAVDPHDQLSYVWTTFEPDDARRVFACFDQPDLKAEFAFTVLAPRAWTVVSNSPSLSRDAAADGDGDVWVFADTPRLSTYVTVVCAGPFHEVRRDGADHDLRLLARASLGAQLDEQAGELLDLTEAGLAWFGERFAMPFPQRAYTQVFCPDFQGAMESYGCVTWTDEVIHRAQPTADQLSRRAVVLLHEMAHMWFGDIVTMRWWDDLWLNESFADWAAHWAAAAATPYRSAWADFTSLKERGYLADRAPTTHPIRQDVPDVAAAMASFDMITYAKGASVLQQLNALVGEEAFVAGLVQHFATHAWANATLDDLLGSLERASGRDLSDWAATWLQAAGTSTLSVRARTAGDGPAPAYAAVTVHQQVPGDPPTLRRHRVDLGVYDLRDGRLRLRERHVVETAGAEVDVDALAGQPVADLLLLNDTDRDFARTPLDERSLATALQHGHTLDDPATRALLRLVLWHEVDDGRLAAAEAVRFALRSLPSETEAARVDALVAMALAGSRWWTGAGREQLQAEVCSASLERAATADPQARATLLQAAASTASPAQVQQVLDAAGDSLPAQWLVLVRRASFGEDVSAQVAALLAVDPDPDAGAWQVAVRAATPERAAKDEVFDLALVRRQLPSTALGRVGAAFWQPGQDALLEPYARRFADLLPSFGTESLLAVGAVLTWFFPRAGVDDGYPALVTGAASAPEVSPVVSASVREKADVLSRMLRARSLTA